MSSIQYNEQQPLTTVMRCREHPKAINLMLEAEVPVTFQRLSVYPLDTNFIDRRERLSEQSTEIRT